LFQSLRLSTLELKLAYNTDQKVNFMQHKLQDPREISISAPTQQLLAELTSAAEGLNKIRPLSPDLAVKVREAFLPDRIVATLNIEGINATRRQTLAVMDAMRINESVGNSEIEIFNALKADEFVTDCCDGGIIMSEMFLREINKLLIQGLRNDAGEFRPGPVTLTNAHFTPPEGPAVPPLVAELVGLFPHSEAMHPVVQAAWLHNQFTFIHPFNDGNGRTGRLLQDWALIRRGLLPVGIPPSMRDDYYSALEMADKGNWDELVEMIANLELKTLGTFQAIATEHQARSKWVSKLAAAASTKQENTRHKLYLVWRTRVERIAAEFKQAAKEVDASSEIIGVTFKEFGVVSFNDWEEMLKKGTADRTWLFSMLFFADAKPFYKGIAYVKRHQFISSDPFPQQRDLAGVYFTGSDLPTEEKPDFFRYSDSAIRLREILPKNDDFVIYSEDQDVEGWRAEVLPSIGTVVEQFFSDAFTRKLGL
jgi:Fic family protein